ncbi:MAG: hypothetical protein HZB51_34240 [Chloroflexi bacterium]|nr:hypothetical protein [Chloroflexota bacterium]
MSATASDIGKYFIRIAKDESWQPNLVDDQRRACLVFAYEQLATAANSGSDLEWTVKRIIAALNTFNDFSISVESQPASVTDTNS